MTDQNEIRLLQVRKSIKTSLTRIQHFVDSFDINDNIEQLNVRNTKIEDLWLKYESTQSVLEGIDFDKHEDDRIVFETKYYETKSNIQKIINDTSVNRLAVITSSSTTISNSNSHSQLPKVKLPQINLPTFTGNYQEWHSFHDIFKSLIHENETLSDIQKLYYLKASLQGEARKVIQSVNVTSENYLIAFKLLVDRFDNKHYIINAHLKSLFDIPVAQKDSVLGLRNLITETKQHLRSLEVLNLPVQQWDTMIIYITAQKLDKFSRREWELRRENNNLPTMEEFFKFLEQRCFSLEAINYPDKPSDLNKIKTSHTTSSSNYLPSCKLCKANHSIYKCEKFLKKNQQDRLSTVKSLGICLNCLKSGHMVKDCKSSTCRKCTRKHNTLIHTEEQCHSDWTSPNTKTQLNTALHNSNSQYQILLGTAIVNILDRKGTWQRCRVLLDSGAQSNFVSTSLINRLKCKTKSIQMPINGINQMQTYITQSADLEFVSTTSDYKKKLTFLVLDNITINLPSIHIDQNKLKLPNVQLADPGFGEPRQVDLLIGAEIYFDLLQQGQIKLGKDLPILQKTKLGWILSGRIKHFEHNNHSTCLVSTKDDLQDQMAKFWEVEQYPKVKHYSEEELKCENYFKTNVERDNTGRFIIKRDIQKFQNMSSDQSHFVRQNDIMNASVVKNSSYSCSQHQPDQLNNETFTHNNVSVNHNGRARNGSHVDNGNQQTFVNKMVYQEQVNTCHISNNTDNTSTIHRYTSEVCNTPNNTEFNNDSYRNINMNTQIYGSVPPVLCQQATNFQDQNGQHPLTNQVPINKNLINNNHITMPNQHSQAVHTALNSNGANYTNENIANLPNSNIDISTVHVSVNACQENEQNFTKDPHSLLYSMKSKTHIAKSECDNAISSPMPSKVNNNELNNSVNNSTPQYSPVKSFANNNGNTNSVGNQTVSSNGHDHSNQYYVPAQVRPPGEPIILIPEPDLSEIRRNRLTRWQLIQSKFQHFWKRWSTEYLHSLQQRTKWNIEKINLQVGDMVLLKHGNMYPLRWKLGRITQVQPGSDGRVRVVTLKTSTGTLKRPISKICILPFENK